MDLPYPTQIASGQDADAEPVQGNLDAINGRLNSVEAVIDNIVVDADCYANGVFPDQLTASQSGTNLLYTSGIAIVNNVTHYKSSITVAFLGEAADTYYVEMDAAGDTDIYTSHDSARTNLNTVVWNGTSFDSVTTADRNVLATYQEIIDARGTYDSVEDRLDAVDDGTTVLGEALLAQTTASLTLSTTHKNVNLNTTSNAITVTVPLASSYLGKSFTLYVGTAVSAHAVTLARSGSDVFISDGSSYTGAIMTLHDVIEIKAMASGVWLVVNHYGVALS